MKNSIKSFFGIGLLIVGLLIIFYTLYSSYNIFITKAVPPEVFEIEVANDATNETTINSGNLGIEAQIEAQMERIIQEQLQGILPAESIFQLLNLIAWSILAGILILGGSQISSLGIRLMI